jgi:hypothetical protein
MSLIVAACGHISVQVEEPTPRFEVEASPAATNSEGVKPTLLPQATSNKEYVDAKGFFSLLPPSGWVTQEYPDDPRGKVAFGDPESGAAINILTQASTMTDFEELVENAERRSVDVAAQFGAEVNLERVTFGDAPALLLTISIPGETKQIQYQFLRGGLLCNLAYAAPPESFDDLLPTALQSLETFEPTRVDLTDADVVRHSVAAKLRRATLAIQSGDLEYALQAVNEGLVVAPGDARFLELKKEIEAKLGVAASGTESGAPSSPSTPDTDTSDGASLAPTASFSANANTPTDHWTTSGPAISFGPDDILHAAWADQTANGPAILYAQSANAGRPLTQTVTVAGDTGADARGAPTIAGGPNGSVALAWEEQRDGAWHIAFSRSPDGKQFTAPVLLDTLGGPGDELQPTLAAGPDGALYLAWCEVGPNDTSVLFSTRGATDGSFPTGRPVSSEGGMQADPTLLVDRQGRVHIAWTGVSEGTPAIYYAWSDDGSSFGQAIKASQGKGEQLPSLAQDVNGHLHLAWAGLFGYTRLALPAGVPASSVALPVYYAFYALSSDGGTTFTPPVAVNDGGSSVSAAPPQTAVAAGDTGTAYVAFLTSSARDGVVLHYDRGKDGQFGEDITLAEAESAPGGPAMAADGHGRVVVAWAERGSGTLVVRVALAENGRPFASEPGTPGAALEPPTEAIFVQGEPFAAPGTPDDIAYDGDHLWLVEFDRVYEVTETGEPVAEWEWQSWTRRGDGLGWADGALWGIGPDVLASYEQGKQALKPVREIELPWALTKTAVYGPHITWDGRSLWVSHEARVYQVDLSSEEIISAFPAPAPVTGLASDGNRLWLATGVFDSEARVHVCDAQGQLIASFPSPMPLHGIAMDDGFLWAVGNTEFGGIKNVYQLNIAEAASYVDAVQAAQVGTDRLQYEWQISEQENKDGAPVLEVVNHTGTDLTVTLGDATALSLSPGQVLKRFADNRATTFEASVPALVGITGGISFEDGFQYTWVFTVSRS